MVEEDFIGLRDVRALRRVSYSSRSFEVLIARCVTIELAVAWINFHGETAMFARIVRPKKQIVGSHGERQDAKDLIDLADLVDCRLGRDRSALALGCPGSSPEKI